MGSSGITAEYMGSQYKDTEKTTPKSEK